MFGTEAVPHTKTALQQLFGDELYQIYYRFLETQPEYFGLLLRLLHRRALVYLRTWIAGRHFAQDCTRCIPRMPCGSWELNRNKTIESATGG